MVPIVLAALSAVVWGVGDFSGGKASQTSRALAVTVLSQLASLPVLAVCVVLVGGQGPDVAALAWGAAGGVVGFVGAAPGAGRGVRSCCGPGSRWRWRPRSPW